jgi:hypothetical protein
MTRRLRTTVAFLVVGLAGTAWGCSKTPVSPDPPSKATVKAVRISGPASIGPGATGQFTAVAEYSDGTSGDVTATTAWATSESAILFFPPGSSGRATAIRRGEADITAAIGGQGSGVHVMVLEPGTYRLSGTVNDGVGTVSNAAVEVVAGIGNGLQTVTDPLGRYALYGVAGTVDVRVTADGFNQQTVPVAVSENAIADVSLRPVAASIDLAGAWALTFTASAVCSAQLPAIARERQFAIDVIQRGVRVELHIAGLAGFLDGRLTGTSLGISMEGDNGIFQAIPGPATLGIDGIVVASLQDQDQEFRGTLNGAFSIYGGANGPSVITCRDRGHQFVMRRR